MASNSLFSDFLQALGVPHTADYSNRQFAGMPFQSMFGLTKLLKSYNIDSQGLKLGDKDELSSLPCPFLADTPDGFVIVTAHDDNTVRYITQGQQESIARTDFINAWNGIVLLAYPAPDASEPDYTSHHTIEIINQAKKYVLVALVIGLFAYLFISNKLYAHFSTIGVTIVDLLGLALTYMLVRKTLNIKDKAADAVCGVLQAGGCDSILKLKASSFFGIFKWSEVGFAYFSVSLLTLLVFPQYTNYLALCNVCCLPFTVWSIWYQKFRAKIWCTLCVSVQASLWLLFICYATGGWLKDLWPLHIEFFVLGAVYLLVLLALNRILPHFDPQKTSIDDDTDTATQA